MSKYDIRRDFEYQNRINEKRKVNNEKRKTNNENEKRKTKNEKQTNFTLLYWGMTLKIRWPWKLGQGPQNLINSLFCHSDYNT